MKKLLSHIKFNAPVTLGFVMACGLALLLDKITGGFTTRKFFSTYRSGLLNPLTYVRALGYTLGHGGWEHFTSNMIYILLLGPLVEEKYGSRNLLEMMGITAVITAIVHALLSSYIALLGASGIVFMLIILSSISNVKSGEIPITFIIICVIFIGGQIVDSFKADSISQLAHIIGGICGGCFGLFLVGQEKDKPKAEAVKVE